MISSEAQNNLKNAKKTKQTYYRRSKVWKLQCYLINAGYSIFEANARIADVYNSTKPTSIILQITRDQKNQSYKPAPLSTSSGLKSFSFF